VVEGVARIDRYDQDRFASSGPLAGRQHVTINARNHRLLGRRRWCVSTRRKPQHRLSNATIHRDIYGPRKEGTVDHKGYEHDRDARDRAADQFTYSDLFKFEGIHQACKSAYIGAILRSGWIVALVRSRPSWRFMRGCATHLLRRNGDGSGNAAWPRSQTFKAY